MQTPLLPPTAETSRAWIYLSLSAVGQCGSQGIWGLFFSGARQPIGHLYVKVEA